jgi:hypothetical protein
MNTEQPTTISVVDPLTPAFERVKAVLFRPFDLGRWFTIGLCAWLAYLGRGGGGGGGPRWNMHGGEAEQAFYEAKEFIVDNAYWIVPVVVVGAIFAIAVYLLLTWLSSRGRFMFLHCVAGNKAEVVIPWKKFKKHANNLFLFRIVVGIICFLVVVIFGLIVLFVALSMKAALGFNVFTITGAMLSAVLFVTLVIVFALIQKFTMDFVVPIMFLRTTSCVTAWREFLALLSVNKARFVLYILFQIVIAVGIGAVILVAALVTCCCAACILAIPYVGTVLMLPILVFKRAYSLYYFQQFGPQFDVFSHEIEPAEPV